MTVLHEGVGAGERVLLLHSGFHTAAEWRRTTTLLAADREVLAPTLPGRLGGRPLVTDRDRSMLDALADDAERVLDEHGWNEPVVVAGSSYGGVVALELALRGRVSAVVGLAPPWTTGPGAIAFYGALFSPTVTMRAQEWLYPRTSRSHGLTGLVFHQRWCAVEIDPADAVEQWTSVGRFPLVRVGVRSRGAGPGMVDLDAAARLGVPVTVAFGTRDPFVPGWMRRRWQAALPRARFVILPGFPHQPHLRDPGLVADLVSSQ